MLKLIHNENIKLYYRKNTVAMIISLIIITILVTLGARIYGVGINRLNVWDAMGGQVWLMFIVNILTLIVASGIVANEFSWGTINFLLIRPVSRSRILVSKYVTVILYSVLLTSLVFGVSFFINTLLYAHNPVVMSISMIEGERIITHNTFGGILTVFVLKCVEVFMYGTIAFTASVVSKNTAFANGFSFIITFLAPLFAYYLPGKYMLFSNLNLATYIDKAGTLDIIGLSFALKILVVYLLLFMLISWIMFVKRDVEA